jgi:hypothetical protein
MHNTVLAHNDAMRSAAATTAVKLTISLQMMRNTNVEPLLPALRCEADCDPASAQRIVRMTTGQAT